MLAEEEKQAKRGDTQQAVDPGYFNLRAQQDSGNPGTAQADKYHNPISFL